eukprot:TRINITY_DN2613_c0_g2_i1.p1 TRINITY_DN2613_c0_g2~~TRINITY_DN2613_c0_g2_i1.p1  ORF type:complete len:699 (-),score=220.76 TRINITY_DN2613_c0_g2_i1:41-2137(-)
MNHMQLGGGQHKLVVRFDFNWDKLKPSKQTLFPIYSDQKEEERVASKGVPNLSRDFLLRATKGVNMHPSPIIKISSTSGIPYTVDEQITLSLVHAYDHTHPIQGSCNCKGSATLGESKPFQITHSQGRNIATIKSGCIEFTKLQIGCCTGNRGHGAPFSIKVEFITEGSPLQGLSIYSLPIEVGAKGPFSSAKTQKVSSNPYSPTNHSPNNSNITSPNSNINTLVSSPPGKFIFKNETKFASKDKEESHNENNNNNSILHYQGEQHQSNNVVSPYSIPINHNLDYEGAEAMLALLNKLNIRNYIPLFLQQEIDLNAFVELKESDLIEMGITKLGPRIKIQKEISKMRKEKEPFTSSMDDYKVTRNESLQSMDKSPEAKRQKISNNNNNGSSNPSPIDSSPISTSSSSMYDSSEKEKEPETNGTVPTHAEQITEVTASLPIAATTGTGSSSTTDAIYLYLSCVTAGKTHFKKALFMVRSLRNRKATDEVVQRIHTEYVNGLKNRGKKLINEGSAQLMLALLPDTKGDWVAWSQRYQLPTDSATNSSSQLGREFSMQSQKLWSFRQGDYIRIDNHHFVDISIRVHNYVIPAGTDFPEHLLKTPSPYKYPTVFPNGYLEIQLDENKEGKIGIGTDLEEDQPSEIFATIHRGKLIATNTSNTDICALSFKRRKDPTGSSKLINSFSLQDAQDLFFNKNLDFW